MKKIERILAVVLALALTASCLGINSVLADSLGEEFKYYCGFENYSEQIEGVSLDAKTSEIVTDSVYAGSKALRVSPPLSFETQPRLM